MRRLGRIIVVGGHSRGVGKTALVEHLLRTSTATHVTAVKISAHRHAPKGCPAPVIEEAFDASPFDQTGRYLSAGAERAWLCRCPTAQLAEAAAFVGRLRADGWDVIVESNRIVEHLAPDLLFFVISGQVHDWKASSGCCLRRADAVVLSRGTLAVPSEATRLAGPGLAWVPVFAFTAAWTVPGIGPWVRAALAHPRPGERIANAAVVARHHCDGTGAPPSVQGTLG
jgi:hypothetical protein